jgi:hypothetical protein
MRTLPPSPLRPYIRFFELVESAEAGAYEVFPSVGSVMGFQYSGRISRVNDGAYVPLAYSGITGPQSAMSGFHAEAGTSSLLVHFEPVGASAFFGGAVS